MLKILINKYSHFIRFCMVGVANTLVNYGVFVILLKMLNIPYLLAGAIGFLTGAAFGFFINRSWTFKVAVSNHYLWIYLLINLLSLLVNGIMQWLSVKYFAFPHVASQFAGIVVTTLLNYFLAKHFVFKQVERMPCV